MKKEENGNDKTKCRICGRDIPPNELCCDESDDWRDREAMDQEEEYNNYFED
jgi:predicted nucleic acid-binding Zn ribbon protein